MPRLPAHRRAIPSPVWVLLLLTVLLPGATAAQDRVALVIGNAAYQHVEPLANPVNDAQAVAESLRRLGFAVTVETEARFDTLRRALIGFGRKARGAEIAVVYFAGHGMEVGGENWLIPTDAELRTDTDVEQEAIGLKSVMFAVSGAERLGLVILDACRNNPFAAKMARTIRSRAVGRGLAQVEPQTNVLVAYAAKDGTTAADGTGAHSPFTEALLRHIERPGLEVSFLFRHVHDDVLRQTQGEQKPFVYGSLSSAAIYLKDAAEPAPSADPSQAVWNVLHGSSDRAALQRFIASFPDSVHRAEAEARLAALSPAEPAAEPTKPARASPARTSPPAPEASRRRAKPTPPRPQKPVASRPAAPRSNCITVTGQRFCP